MENGNSTNIDLFFKKYRQVCRIVDDRIVLRYPNLGRMRPRIPLIKRQEVDLSALRFTGFQNTRERDSNVAKYKTVGFFMADCRFEHVCYRPWDYTEKLSQYKQILTPDLSCLPEMSIEEQWLNTYLNRLVGAFWQQCGIIVIPTVSWSDKRSYWFCFSGLERGSVVAVSTIGTKAKGEAFMAGFRELCRRIEPQAVICYCSPYLEMFNYSKIIPAEHEGNIARRKARHRLSPGQMTFYDLCDNF
jgi:hypothetical protein